MCHAIYPWHIYRMKTLSSLSIFFPAYNDAQSLPLLVARAEKTAQKVTKKYEIIIVNDGSTDDTEVAIKRLGVRRVTHPKNRGYGAALISGFNAARYDWIFYTDGDGQYDPSELSKLVRYSEKNDIVNGYKILRHDFWYRILIGNVYNTALHILFRLPIRDIDCDFRLIRHSTLQGVSLKAQSGAICLELITKLQKRGARFAEVAVHHYPRPFGRSQFFSFSRIVKTWSDLLYLMHEV